MSGDVSFRRPAVELLVVTMHSWALPCHTKRANRPGRSTRFELKFWGGVLHVSGHNITEGAAEFIIFSRSPGIFPHFAETSDHCLFFFSSAHLPEIVGVDQ